MFCYRCVYFIHIICLIYPSILVFTFLHVHTYPSNIPHLSPFYCHSTTRLLDNRSTYTLLSLDYSTITPSHSLTHSLTHWLTPPTERLTT
jgi:hypothetical protein